MTYVAAGLIGAALGLLLTYVVVALTFRSERRKRGGDISEAIRGARR